jgi:hypothetical protein
LEVGLPQRTVPDTNLVDGNALALVGEGLSLANPCVRMEDGFQSENNLREVTAAPAFPGGLDFHLVLAPSEVLGRDPSAQITHRLGAALPPGKRSL